MSKIADEKLIKTAIEGDTEAVDILKDRIKSVALPIIKEKGIQISDEERENMGKQIEEKVINALPKFIFRISFEEWVHRITVNEIIGYQRKVMKQRHQSENNNGSNS